MTTEAIELINKAKDVFPELNNDYFIENIFELNVEFSQLFFKHYLLEKKIDTRFIYFINSFFEERNLNSEEKYFLSEFALDFSTKENEQIKNDLFSGLNDKAINFFSYSINLWKTGNKIED